MNTLPKLVLCYFTLYSISECTAAMNDVLPQTGDIHSPYSKPTRNPSMERPTYPALGEEPGAVTRTPSELEQKREIVRKEIKRIENLRQDVAKSFKGGNQDQLSDDPYIQEYNARIEELTNYLPRIQASTSEKTIFDKIEEIQNKHHPIIDDIM